MGTLADRFGRRRLFVIGVGLFTLASLLCGLATSATFLHLARGPAGRRRRGDVRDLAGADRPGVPGPRARHRDRRLGRDDRRRGRGRAAGRRGAHRRARLGVDLLRQRPDRDRHRDPRPDPGRRVARSRGQAPRLGGPDHLLARALRADLRPAARQRRGLGQRADRRRRWSPRPSCSRRSCSSSGARTMRCSTSACSASRRSRASPTAPSRSAPGCSRCSSTSRSTCRA